MPVQVNEIIIKATIENENSALGSEQKNLQQPHDALVSECVEQVLAILKKQEER